MLGDLGLCLNDLYAIYLLVRFSELVRVSHETGIPGMAIDPVVEVQADGGVSFQVVGLEGGGECHFYVGAVRCPMSHCASDRRETGYFVML